MMQEALYIQNHILDRKNIFTRHNFDKSRFSTKDPVHFLLHSPAFNDKIAEASPSIDRCDRFSLSLLFFSFRRPPPFFSALVFFS
jgi:hypothetical protein